jgi:cyclopropane fatty-acyl-phospholipid synthase-like methyltransferase
MPASSELPPIVDAPGSLVTDIEILRRHSPETLWRGRLLAHRDLVDRIYHRRFCRTWEFHLALAETS